MGKHKLREDKKCQNCGGFVRKRYCPKCGQENIETRKSFHYLFTHFIEDLVHYDGSFWKTLKNLFFKPGILTKTYLDGKRKRFVAPVKLYIFVSFFVFFVGGIISKITPKEEIVIEGESVDYGLVKITPPNQTNDSLKNETSRDIMLYNPKEYDSIQASLPELERDSGLERVFNKKLYEVERKYTRGEFVKKVSDSVNANFQKFLFFFMPVFAFFMWLFYNKKKWYYFDHGIFTLHYFSFLLCVFFISNSVIGTVSYLFNHWSIIFFAGLLKFILYLWSFIYFFKALRKVYGYSRINTLVRGIFLSFVNMIFFILGILFYIFIILLIV